MYAHKNISDHNLEFSVENVVDAVRQTLAKRGCFHTTPYNARLLIIVICCHTNKKRFKTNPLLMSFVIPLSFNQINYTYSYANEFQNPTNFYKFQSMRANFSFTLV